jgi:hypothetical protein
VNVLDEKKTRLISSREGLLVKKSLKLDLNEQFFGIKIAFSIFYGSFFEAGSKGITFLDCFL